GVGIGGDRIGAGGDEGVVRAAHKIRALDQRQRRPFRLPERRAAPRQFAAHAAIQQNRRRRHAAGFAYSSSGWTKTMIMLTSSPFSESGRNRISSRSTNFSPM